MKVTALADLHGYYPVLPGGDLLILAGDYTAADKLSQWAEFFNWLKRQDYRKKILVGGNHDRFLESGMPKTQREVEELKEVQEFLEVHEDYEYLCDSGTEFEGVKIWGSPWSNWFSGVNPRCTAFMEKEHILQEKFKLIPYDTDILVTHCPPWMILDANVKGDFCGSTSLRLQIEKRPKIKVHVFGHIHEQGGKELLFKREGYGHENNSICYNVSHVNERYEPVNKPTSLKL